METRTLFWLKSFSRVMIAACVVICSAPLLVAQSRLCAVTGLVTDSQGLAIPGAAVSVTNEATGVKFQTQADNAGMYRVENLVVGSYRIEVTSSGFQTVVRTGLVLETALIERFDATLAVGNVKQTVEVSGAPTPLQTESSEVVGQMAERRELQEIPNTDRKYTNLMSLSVLTTSSGDQFFGHAYPTGAGSVTNSSSMYMNGAQASDIVGNSFLYSFSSEFVDQFKVIPNSVSAVYAGDRAMVVTTKSGTNGFHGQGDFFIQDATFNANPWGATSLLPFRNDEFGGQVGGPIKKNKTFFFAGFQYRSYIQDLPFFDTLPTVLQKGGDFSQTLDANGNVIPIYDPATTACNTAGVCTRKQFPGNVIPPKRIDPVGASILGFFPNPNTTGTITGGNNYLGTSDTSQPHYGLNIRVDQQWSNKDSTFIDYNRDVVNGSFPSYFGIPGFGSPGEAAVEDFPMYEVTGTNTYTPNPKWVLATSVMFMNFRQVYKDLGYNQNLPATKWGLTGMPSVIGYPDVSMAGYSGAGGGGEFGQLPIRNYSFGEDVTTIRGKHSLKFGYTLVRIHQMSFVGPSSSLNFGTQPTAQPNVADTGNAVAALLLGFPLSASEFPGFNIIQNIFEHEAYVQDDWKALPNLTVNAGVRWDGFSEWNATDPEGAPFTSSFSTTCINPVSGTPGCVLYGGVDYPNQVLPWTNKYFAPRLGLAWLPWGAGSKTVVRAGAGIYWLPLEDAGAGGGAGITFCCFNSAQSGSFSSSDNGITAPFYLKNGLPPLPAFSVQDHGFGAVPVGQKPRVAVSYVDRSAFRRTYAEEYNLTVQRQLSPSIEVSGAYLHYLGVHVAGQQAVDQLRPSQFGPGNAQIIRPFPQYGGVTDLMNPGFRSDYNALFLEAKKRYSKGLNFDVQYVFGKSLINTSPWNAYDFRPWEMVEPQHRFVGYAVYDLPWGAGRHWLTSGPASKALGGWVLTPVVTLVSGSHMDITYNTNTTNGFTQGNQGVNLVGNPKGPRTMTEWFNTAAFAPPAPYTFGNNARSDVEGPGTIACDIAISRIDKFSDRWSTQFGADFFNAFNHSNLNGPDTGLGDPTFGVISAKSGNRQIQLRLRVFF